MAAPRIRHLRTAVGVAETLSRCLPDAMAALDRRSGQGLVFYRIFYRTVRHERSAAERSVTVG